MGNIKSEINDALCEQISHEMKNVLTYAAISSYFESMRLRNLSSKFKKQSEEEFEHFNKIIDYLNTRLGGKYIPVEIDNPIISINSPREAANLYLEVELGTTSALESVAEIIYDLNSFMDYKFINEMVAIQIEEEDNADEFKKKIEMVSDIVLFDASLGD